MKSLFIITRLALLCAFLGLSSWSIAAAAEPKAAGDFRLDKKEDGIEVYLGDQMVTKYWHKSGTKPILWPIVGPEGLKRTRAYPMDDKQPGEERDHIHHRSLWFTHGEVNGVDFWAEKEGSGLIEHRSFGKVEGGKSAIIETTSDWVTRDGKTLLNEDRTMTFGHDASARWIDFDITLTAGKEDVHFGDTKEGSFGVRVAESMKVDAKGQPGGTIINSEGQTNGDAWGKPASWVDYHGLIQGKHCGTAIMVHPKSFNYPGRWHVRTYGLFAANPFGEYHFTGAKEKTAGHTLKAGTSLNLIYRVVFHSGDEKEGSIEKHWNDFSKAQAAK